MNKKFYHLLLLLGVIWVNQLFGNEKIVVKPENAQIIINPNAGAICQFAAKELQYHLKLICGVDIPISSKADKEKYLFRFDKKVKNAPLRSEEGRWSVGDLESCFDGDDTVSKGNKLFNTVLHWKLQNGTMNAVYDFLEAQFNILWLEPGENGLSYSENKVLNLKRGNGGWTPGNLVMREIRTDYSKYAYPIFVKSVPKVFLLDKKAYDKKNEETLIWLKRQRMGCGMSFNYGHAFTNWVKLYSKTHPEYLALQADGHRGSKYKKLNFSKLCVSNSAVVDQIIKDWAKKKAPFLNICENDADGYCLCEKCCSWDVPKSGEKPLTHVTDRYVKFVNNVQEKAQSIRPDVSTIFYAYAEYRFPPRKEKINNKTILGFVPSMLELKKTEEEYSAWHKMGANRIFLRPNDQHINTGLPMGFEKQMFDAFKLGVKYGIIGTDYDALHGYWHVTGVADYILARAHVYPEKTFDELFDEYCSGYGSAVAEVKEYYTYWRKEVWEKRLLHDSQKILTRGRYGNFRRGLMWDIRLYYNISDFDKTDKILTDGLARKDLSKQVRNRLELLQLANKHARLLYQTLGAKPNDKFNAARNLYQFRIANKDKLNFNWMNMTKREDDFGDIAGTKQVIMFANFEDNIPLPIYWHLTLDKDDSGIKEKWFMQEPNKFLKKCSTIRTDSYWEMQKNTPMPENLKKTLTKYDGLAWYARNISIPPAWKGSKIFLHFGGVDENAIIFVNGKKAGERICKKENDYKEPFNIRIDEQIDWSKKNQFIVVRVQDSAGLGGIHKRIILLKGK